MSTTVRARALFVDDSALRERMKDFRQDQVPFAMKTAVNELAWDTIRAEKIEMGDVFDRPTRFVLQGLRIAKKATKNDPTAAIWFKDVFGKFGEAIERTLLPHVYGGRRDVRSSEKRLRAIGVLRSNEWLVAGGGARLNAAGNVSPQKYVQMLSYFRAFTEAGYNANRVRGQSSSRRGLRFFVNRAGNGKGIYEVRGKGKPRLIFKIVDRAPQYDRRFDFFGEAERHAALYSGYFAKRAMQKALKTAR